MSSSEPEWSCGTQASPQLPTPLSPVSLREELGAELRGAQARPLCWPQPPAAPSTRGSLTASRSWFKCRFPHVTFLGLPTWQCRPHRSPAPPPLL